MKIGIVSCDKYKNKILEDIMLKDVFRSKKIEADIISWESDNTEEYDVFIIRSIWGYQYRYNELMKWIKATTQKNKIIFNDYETIKSNIDKKIQYDLLSKNGIPVIPYRIVDDKNRNLTLEINKTIKTFQNEGYSEFVIKPSISESGENTYFCKLNDKIKIGEISNEFENIIYNMPYEKIIIQPFFNEIKNGEYSCIVLGGRIIRKMIRFPGLFTERKEIKKVDFIYDDEKKLVRKIQKCYNNAVYMRADYIRVNGKIQLMELELVDPDLMTRKLKSKKEKNEFIEKFANEILKGINNI
jgi:hypothetical protein